MIERKRLEENCFERRSSRSKRKSICHLIPGMECSIKGPRIRGSECRHERRDARREAGTICLKNLADAETLRGAREAQAGARLACSRKREGDATCKSVRSKEEGEEEGEKQQGRR